MTEGMQPSTPAPDTLWYYADASNEAVGPLPMDVLQKLAAAGVIQPETYVIEKGASEWKKFAAVVPPFSSAEQKPDPVADVAHKPAPTDPRITEETPQGIWTRVLKFFSNRERRLPTFVALLFLYPIGLLLLRQSNAFTKRGKVVTAVAFGVALLCGIFGAPHSNSNKSGAEADSALKKPKI